MKVLGIIPARYASSRFPGKPLLDLKGKPMIQHVYENASKCIFIDKIVVATDDVRIYDVVKAFGGEVMMTSEKHLSGTDRCGEVAQAFTDYSVIVNIQGDEPLVNPKQLQQLITAFTDDEVKIATLGTQNIATEDFDNPNRIKLVKNYHNDALFFSRSAIPNTYHAKEEAKKAYPFLRHIGLYAYTNEVLQKIIDLKPSILEQVESLEQLRWMYYGFKIRVVETEIETPNIDVPEDVEKVLKFL